MFKAASGAVFRRVKSQASGSRSLLNALLADGHTVANYQRGIGITGTTNASAWANQIGAAGPLLQATGANQPTINADGSLTFNGSSQWMEVTVSYNQPATYYLVMRQETWTSGRYFLATNTIGNGNALLQTATGGVTPHIEAFAGSEACDNGNLAVGALGVVTAVFNGASSSIKVNGTAATTGNPGAQVSNRITIGATSNAHNTWANISVYEVIARPVLDSVGTQATIQSILKSIYGTP